MIPRLFQARVSDWPYPSVLCGRTGRRTLHTKRTCESVDEYAVEETVEDLDGLAAVLADGEQGFAVKLDGVPGAAAYKLASNIAHEYLTAAKTTT